MYCPPPLLLLCLDHPCLLQLQRLPRPVLCVYGHLPHPPQDTHPRLYAPKNRVLAIQPRCWCQRQEKLAAVRVGPCICHAQHARTCVLELQLARWRRNLVLKLGAVDALTTAPRPCGVAALHHEIGNYAVENGAIVVATLGQRDKVAACARRVFCVELDRDGALDVLEGQVIRRGE